MKATLINTKPVFEPVKVELVFETEEELNDLYNILSFSPIVESVPSDVCRTIRKVLGDEDFQGTGFQSFTKSLREGIQ